MKRTLIILFSLFMLYGCAIDLQSISNEIRIPFVSDQGSTQKKSRLLHQKDGHSQSSQLDADKQGQRSGE